MTASEWLASHFSISNDHFSPMSGYTASVSFFVDSFGTALEAALANRTSTYDAVMGVIGGTRGWRVYFDEWKRLGILQ